MLYIDNKLEFYICITCKTSLTTDMKSNMTLPLINDSTINSNI